MCKENILYLFYIVDNVRFAELLLLSLLNIPASIFLNWNKPDKITNYEKIIHHIIFVSPLVDAFYLRKVCMDNEITKSAVYFNPIFYWGSHQTNNRVHRHFFYRSIVPDRILLDMIIKNVQLFIMNFVVKWTDSFYSWKSIWQ